MRASDFTTFGNVIQLGVPPVRIDIITSIDGVSWKNAWKKKVSGKYGDTTAFFIGRQELILNKRALGRKQDITDLDALGETY